MLLETITYLPALGLGLWMLIAGRLRFGPLELEGWKARLGGIVMVAAAPVGLVLNNLAVAEGRQLDASYIVGCSLCSIIGVIAFALVARNL